jgi:hypothetical protein
MVSADHDSRRLGVLMIVLQPLSDVILIRSSLDGVMSTYTYISIACSCINL